MFQSMKAGCFKPGQFGAKIDNLELVKDLHTELYVTIASEDCYFEIIPGKFCFQDILSDLSYRISLVIRQSFFLPKQFQRSRSIL